MSSPTRLFSLSLILTFALLFHALSTCGQSTDAKSKATGSISGRITINGKAAAAITVAAFAGDVPNRQSIARTTTDSEGRYHLFGLTPAQYQITALAPSLAVADQSSYSGSYYGLGKSILLSAAETVEDVDIKLARGSVITGRVIDSDGQPVIEQRVNLQIVDQNGNPTRQEQPYLSNYEMNQTDDRGVYRIYGLPSGRYRVSVGNDPNSRSMSSNSHGYYRLTFYPDVNDPAKATIVELNEGSEATNIDIRVGHLANTYVATGHIVDSDTGQPVTGIRLMYGLAPRSQEFFGGFISGLVTNTRGEFRIEGLEPGRYGVSLASQFDSVNVYSDPIFFEVSDSDVSNLEIKATHGLTLRGMVVIDGVATKELLTQLATLRITASVASPSNPQARTSGSSPIAGDGSFQINGLRPGRVNLFIYAAANPNLRGLAITQIEHDGLDVTQNLEIQPGQSISDLRVVMILGTGAIRGMVNFEGGDRPADARILIGVRREGTSSGGSGILVDARGHFLIKNLTPGTYEITLNIASGPPQPPSRLSPPQKQIVNVVDDGEAQVTFTVDLKIKGP